MSYIHFEVMHRSVSDALRTKSNSYRCEEEEDGDVTIRIRIRGRRMIRRRRKDLKEIFPEV